MFGRSLCAGLLLSALAGPLASVDAPPPWAGFKGMGGTGVGTGRMPTTWNVETGLNIAWRTRIPGIGHSSPVVWGQQVFVTTAVADGAAEYAFGLDEVGLDETMAPARDDRRYAWQVMSLDTATGGLQWRRTLREGYPRAKRHAKNSFASPTPATDGRYLVVFFGSEGLFCLDLRGRVLWRRDLGVMRVGNYQDATDQWGIATSPVIYRDLVLLQIDLDAGSFLAAYDLRTGREVWRRARHDGQSWSTPALYVGPAGDTVVTNAQTHVRGYDPQTGAPRWDFRWGLEIVLSTPTVANELIYTASGKGDDQPILAIRPTARGTVQVGYGKPHPALAWSRHNGGAIVTSPLVYGECLYALVDLGILRCFEAATGAIVYQQRINDNFMASPVAADGKVYLTGEDGNVHVVRAGRQYASLAVNDLGEPCMATPAFGVGRMFFRTASHLIAVSA